MLARRCFFRVCVLFIIGLIGNLWLHVVGQEVYTDEQLKSMTAEELESICNKRGFEISTNELDPATGLSYELTHDDFVEAARQCLNVEQEMNELLAEYPELAAEVEEEIKKMEAEKLARQSEVEALQNDLKKAEESAGQVRSSPGSAFVSSESTTNISPSTTMEKESDFEILDDGDSVTESDPASTAEETIAEDIVKEETVPVAEPKDAEVMANNETKSDEDFTVSAMTFEIIRAMVKQVESDVKRIVELMTPVIRPILRAGDVAWRHIKVAFESLRHNYENSRGGGEDDSKTSKAAS